GDILRDAVSHDTEIGRRAQAIMARGQLVSDEVMIGIVRERLERADALGGFVLDGFPRTVPQARALDEMMDGRDPVVVVDIVVPLPELVRRLSTRMICADCGANAGSFADATASSEKVVMPPAAGGTAAESVLAVQAMTETARCRRCGGPLIQRTDDNAAIVLDRLTVYEAQTKPLVEYYRNRPTFRSIDGAQAPDLVAADLASAIEAAWMCRNSGPSGRPREGVRP